MAHRVAIEHYVPAGWTYGHMEPTSDDTADTHYDPFSGGTGLLADYVLGYLLQAWRTVP
jgi:hypothetical protein